MIVRDYRPLYQQLEEAHSLFPQLKTKEERLAFYNYLENIYCALLCMGDQDADYRKDPYFQDQVQYGKFLKDLDTYSERLIQNYLQYKDFHKEYLGEIVAGVEDRIQEIRSIPSVDMDPIPEKDFYEILFSFLSSIGEKKILDSFLQKNHIYSSVIGHSDGNIGFTLYNPFSRECHLFVKQFDYTFPNLNTLIHEIGHGIDYQHFQGDMKEFNQYFYLSYYEEVISRMMERLFHRYCLQNGILVPEAKDSYASLEGFMHDFLLESYMFSLFDKEILTKGRYVDCDREELVQKIKDHFVNEEALRMFLTEAPPLDLSESYSYAYGDIISLFLTEEVEKNGMNSELMEYFYWNAKQPFSDTFIRECGFGPKNYQDLYEKEIQLIKK